MPTPEPHPDVVGDGDGNDRDRFGTRADLPFAGPERATAVMRGQPRALRDHAVSTGPARIQDWDTLTIEGPDEHVDPDGRSGFTYTATVGTRPFRPLDPPAADETSGGVGTL